MKKFNFNYVILIFLVAFNLRLGISSVPPIQTIIQESLRLSNFQVMVMSILCTFEIERPNL